MEREDNVVSSKRKLPSPHNTNTNKKPGMNEQSSLDGYRWSNSSGGGGAYNARARAIDPNSATLNTRNYSSPSMGKTSLKKSTKFMKATS